MHDVAITFQVFSFSLAWMSASKDRLPCIWSSLVSDGRLLLRGFSEGRVGWEGGAWIRLFCNSAVMFISQRTGLAIAHWAVNKADGLCTATALSLHSYPKGPPQLLYGPSMATSMEDWWLIYESFKNKLQKDSRLFLKDKFAKIF